MVLNCYASKLALSSHGMSLTKVTDLCCLAPFLHATTLSVTAGLDLLPWCCTYRRPSLLQWASKCMHAQLSLDSVYLDRRTACQRLELFSLYLCTAFALARSIDLTHFPGSFPSVARMLLL
jgi:hypothetical protein